jgi:hypothetical protein
MLVPRGATVAGGDPLFHLSSERCRFVPAPARGEGIGGAARTTDTGSMTSQPTKPRSRTSRLLRAAGITALVGLVLLLAAFLGYMSWIHPGYEPLEFTPEAWTSADAETRGHMSHSLLSRHELVGLTWQELLELLGPPDAITTLSGEHEERRRGATTSELISRFGGSEGEGMGAATYRLGFMGYRSGAPLVFPWSLHVYFQDGAVIRTRVAD